MQQSDTFYDVAIVGGGLAGVVALAYARRAGLEAIVLERQARVGGLWRDLPAWQDVQISPADWAVGDLPLQGATQPHILANIEAWVERFRSSRPSCAQGAMSKSSFERTARRGPADRS